MVFWGKQCKNPAFIIHDITQMYVCKGNFLFLYWNICAHIILLVINAILLYFYINDFHVRES